MYRPIELYYDVQIYRAVLDVHLIELYRSVQTIQLYYDVQTYRAVLDVHL